MTQRAPAIDTAFANNCVLVLACAVSVVGAALLPLDWRARLGSALIAMPFAAYLWAATLFEVGCRSFGNRVQ